MREQVSIVLNEREPNKSKAADALIKRLGQLNITASRIEITEDILELVKQRRPAVLILDYLLGDFSTGLDVQSALEEIDSTKRPQIIFFTDEPSVQVAVSAMLKGAVNYYELDNPQAINEIALEVERLLSNRPAKNIALPRPPPGSDDLVAISEASISMLRATRLCIAKNCPLVFLSGPPGSGVSTIAQVINNERKAKFPLFDINLRHFDEDIQDKVRSALGFDADKPRFSLLIENVEEDDGKLFNLLMSASKEFKTLPDPENHPVLIVSSSCAETLKAWQRELPVTVIDLPSLKKRQQDIPALIQNFLREAEELADKKIKPFDASIVNWLSSLDWPGELRHLRSVIFDAGISSTFPNMDPKLALEQTLAAWNTQFESTQADKPALDPVLAASMLQLSNFDYRISAARLGCSVKDLLKLARVESPT